MRELRLRLDYLEGKVNALRIDMNNTPTGRFQTEHWSARINTRIDHISKEIEYAKKALK